MEIHPGAIMPSMLSHRSALVVHVWLWQGPTLRYIVFKALKIEVVQVFLPPSMIASKSIGDALPA
eukprot:9105298-Karenia_brevis.AAC.1